MCDFGYRTMLANRPRTHFTFKIGDEVLCVNADNTREGSRLEAGRVYTVTQVSGYHGLDQVYVDGDEGFRHLASRFERAEKNPWLRRKQESTERPPTPIRVDFGPINIPNSLSGPCGQTPTIPSSIAWDFNLPSVIVLTGVNIPSVITLSGIGD